jgi:hypothetical protein
MQTVSDFYAALKAPFPVDEVSWRIGSTTKDKKKGQALAYIDARSVFDRLDAVCSNFGWQCNYSHAASKDAKTICNLGLLMPVGPADADLSTVDFQWIWRADGAGDTDFEGEKGAISDALKRAAVRFGVGRYLYSLPAPWVSLVEKGSSHVIDPNEYQRLNKELEKVAPSGGSSQTIKVSNETALQIAIKAMSAIENENEVIKFAQENAMLIQKLDNVSKTKFRTAYQDAIKSKKGEQLAQ